MSLHIKLSPEAQARLAKQQRQSTIMSIAIAILTCVLLALLMTLIAIKVVKTPIPVIVTVNASSSAEDAGDVQPIERVEPPTPPEDISQVLTSQTLSDIAIPTIEDPFDFNEPVEDLVPEVPEFGEIASSDVETSDVKLDVLKLPLHVQKRCGNEDRLNRLRKNGAGSRAEDAENAVTKSLEWLKETQNEDGSWTQSKYKPAMTGLALLSFLGRCETPKSRDYGKTVLNGMSYLVDVGLKNNGLLTNNKSDKHFPYEHAIATYALGEALTFSKVIDFEMEGLEEVLQKAGNIIIKGQRESGSWTYNYHTKAIDKKSRDDNSVGGWQIQALKACYHSKLEFKGIESTIKRALGHFQTHQDKDGAVGYITIAREGEKFKLQNQAMTAVAALSHQIWNKSSGKFTRKALEYLSENMKFNYNSPSMHLYGHYYAAQVMLNAGDEYWKDYNAQFLPGLLSAQNPDGTFKKANNGGAINNVVSAWQHEKTYGTHYRTCLATLMLETYYRFLPATGRKTR